ncbi:hypothetical protein B9Z55_011220 [Caenorhabditis nigoni]|uniref:C2H2-type domain-containing protein n=1 Tax=Caenorhabditis nigoni TaxID=1611254 RepID=A0A2G5UJ58_9PELO|nr:hypothetical protein B9Z55_011220 [Caenorhabditis nigoni]
MRKKKYYDSEKKFFWCGFKEKPHDTKEEPCGFVGTNSEVTEHFSSHTGVYRLRCTTCYKTFYEDSTLVHHQETNTCPNTVEFIANDKKMITFHHRLKNICMTQISGDNVKKLRDAWEKRQKQHRPVYSDITDPLSLATKVPLPLDVFPVTKVTPKTPSYDAPGNRTPHHYVDNQPPVRKPSYEAQGNRTPNRSTSIPAPSHRAPRDIEIRGRDQDFRPQGPPARHQDLRPSRPPVQSVNGWEPLSDPRLQRSNDPRSQPRSRTPDECWREPPQFAPPAPNSHMLANDVRSSTSLGFRSQQPRVTDGPNEYRDQSQQIDPVAPNREMLANDARSSTSLGFHSPQPANINAPDERRFTERIIAHQIRIAPESDHQGTRVFNNTPIHRPNQNPVHSPEFSAPTSPISAPQVRMAPASRNPDYRQNQKSQVPSPVTQPGIAEPEVRIPSAVAVKASGNQDPRLFYNSQVQRQNQNPVSPPTIVPQTAEPVTPNVPPQRVAPPAPVKESDRTTIFSDSMIQRLNEIRQMQALQKTGSLESSDLAPCSEDLQLDVSNQNLPRVHKTQNHPKDAGERRDVCEEDTSTPKPSELPQKAVPTPAPSTPVGPNPESQQPTNPLGLLPWNDLPNLRKFIPDFLGKSSEDISLPSPSPSEHLPPPPVLPPIAVKISTAEASSESALPTPEQVATPARLAPMHFKGSSGRKIAKSKIAVFNSPSPVKASGESSKDRKKNGSLEASLPAPDRPPGILAAEEPVPEKRQTPKLISSVFDYLPHLEASAASAQSFRNSCTSSSRSPSPSPDRKRRHPNDSDGKGKTRRRSRSRSRHQETSRDSSNEQGWSTPRPPKKLRRESVELVHGSTSGSDMDIESDCNSSPEVPHQGKIDSSVFMTFGREPSDTGVRLISIVDLPAEQDSSDPSGQSNPTKPLASPPLQQLVSLVDQVDAFQSGQRTSTVSNARLPPAYFEGAPVIKHPNQPPSGSSGTSALPPPSQRNLYQKLSRPNFDNLKGTPPDAMLAQYREWKKSKEQAN